MKCKSCFDESEEEIGYGRTRIIRIPVDMERTCGDTDGFTYHQCPRCGRTKKRKEGFFTAGLAYDVEPQDYPQDAPKKPMGKVAKVAVGVGAAILVGALLEAASKKS
ncbi:MAG: hypothetical protein WC819_03540 [Parcubacteria group bacterium]|jgi:hypothetical protein